MAALFAGGWDIRTDRQAAKRYRRALIASIQAPPIQASPSLINASEPLEYWCVRPRRCGASNEKAGTIASDKTTGRDEPGRRLDAYFSAAASFVFGATSVCSAASLASRSAFRRAVFDASKACLLACSCFTRVSSAAALKSRKFAPASLFAFVILPFKVVLHSTRKEGGEAVAPPPASDAGYSALRLTAFGPRASG